MPAGFSSAGFSPFTRATGVPEVRMLAVRTARFLEAISGLGLFLMVGVILLQVALRYGFSDGLIWGEEFARIMMIGAALLGAAVAHWQSKHIRFDLLEQILPPRARRAMAVLSELIVLGTAVALAISGWQLAAENEMQESLTLGVSMLYVYALVPVGFAWMALASLRRLVVVTAGLPGDNAGAPGDAS